MSADTNTSTRAPLALLRSHRGLVVVLVLGVVLRAVLIGAITPAHLNYIDSWGYAKEADGPLFLSHFYRPAGYSAFLGALAALWPSLPATIILQHLLGLFTVVLVYAAMLRLGQPRWVALVPAVVVALSGDVVYFEHTLLSEWLFMLLLVGALFLAAGLTQRPVPVRPALGLAAGAGLLLGLASTTRGMGMFAVPVFALVALLRPSEGLKARVLPAAALVLAAGAVLLVYAGAQYRATDYFGFTDGRGWALYARVAPFADCSAFTPPAGTRVLCEKTDARTRSGPDHYMWDGDSPAMRVVAGAGPPKQDKLMGSFGRAAALGQPKAYARAVARDLWRFVDPDGRVGFGQPPSSLNLSERNVAWEQVNRTAVDPLYGPSEITFHASAKSIGSFQELSRVRGALVLLATLLTLLAFPFTGRAGRLALALLGGTAIVALVLSVASQEYNWRFAVPLLPLLVASGAVGARVVVLRLVPARARHWPRARAPEARPVH
jgi:hypothetical protein